VFALSSLTGDGVAELDAYLRRMARESAARPASGLFRLAVDRVFTLAGVGTVVTGTVHAGTVSIGDEVAIAPDGPRARVRSVHAQDRAAQQGVAGQRCALNLAGLAREDVARASGFSRRCWTMPASASTPRSGSPRGRACAWASGPTCCCTTGPSRSPPASPCSMSRR